MAVGAWAWWRDDGSLARAQARGTLRFGLALEAPYALLGPDGSPTGESPGVARAVAAALQLHPEWIVTAFERLIDELRAERFDVIAAGLFISPERVRRLRFCRPQLRVLPGWLTAEGNPAGLAAYAEVGPATPLRVAVLEGSVEAAAFVRQGVPPDRLLRVPDARSGVAAVRTGAADGLALSWPSVVHLAAEAGPQLQAVSAAVPGQPSDRVAMAVRPGDRALQAAIDGVLAGYLGGPSHLGLLRSLGLSAADLPGGADALQ